ncbi:hypothetical protein TSUD_32820 [Trifolium subterraneum]|uniref:EGF-like domain-containing protein n=1 Tax=Trifolium subterraneum TaxID=3900 RepID=A0A2Z6LQV2_TRISU|nr:hypothetical protein TSUD_32820 [Trifolium subterraneum]
MGSSKLLGLIAMTLMLLLPMAAKGDIIDDVLNKVCEEVECGKGNCVVNTSYPLNFVCECQSGWKRTQDEDDDIFATSFLPCVIPQCSLNYGCQPAPPPVPEKSLPHNFSAFDRTLGSDCSSLGIKVADSTSTTGADSDASSITVGRFHWIVMLLISTGMVMWS